MNWASTVGLFLLFWCIFYFVDFYFRIRNPTAYLSFVERTGVVVSPFQIRWYSSQFHSWLVRCRRFLRRRFVRRLFDVWFFCGACSTVFISTLMLVFLSKLLWNDAAFLYYWMSRTFGQTVFGRLATTTVHESSSLAPENSGTSPGLIPVIPGVNVPWRHMPLFLASLVLAGVIHEAGHSFAALHENVGVSGFGVFVLVVYPGAFTELDAGALRNCTVWQKLKIYSAGIWHNLMLAALGLLALKVLPYLLSPAYMCDKGVVVTGVDAKSDLNGPAGLNVGQVIYGVGHCKVYNERSWLSCLQSLQRTQFGYCIPSSGAAAAGVAAQKVSNVAGEFDCCSANQTRTHLCFFYQKPRQLLRRRQGRAPTAMPTLEDARYSCLPARYVTDHGFCSGNVRCSAGASCVFPALFNGTRLLRFFMAGQSKAVLFVGAPEAEVAGAVFVSSYVPKFGLAPAAVPVIVDLFLKYLIMFSLALALLNAVPCYSLDGEFVFAALLVQRGRSHTLAYRLILAYGTILLIGTVATALVKFLSGLR